MKRKILIFFPNFDGGGAERVTLNIINRLDYNRFEVYLILATKQGALFKELPENIKTEVLFSRRTIYSILGLRKRIANYEPDVVFSSLIMANICVYISLLFNKRRKKVNTIFRSPNLPSLLRKYKQLSYIKELFAKLAYRSADIVVAQTPEMRKELYNGYGLNRDKVVSIRNPLDEQKIDIGATAPNPLNHKEFNFVASGRFTYQKGFDLLVTCFKEFIMSYDYQGYKFHLTILGSTEGHEFEKIKSLVEELDLTQFVTFPGFCENPYAYYRNADVFVLSSRWEGLPNTVLENIYLKNTIVASRCIEEISTLVKDGSNGYTFEVDDKKGMISALKKSVMLPPVDSQYENSICDYENIFMNDKSC